MPLDELSTMLSDRSNIRVAWADELIPNVELKYATDEFDRESIDNAIAARIAGRSLPIARSNSRSRTSCIWTRRKISRMPLTCMCCSGKRLAVLNSNAGYGSLR